MFSINMGDDFQNWILEKNCVKFRGKFEKSLENVRKGGGQEGALEPPAP